MKHWWRLGASGWVLLICSAAFSFCCLFDPSSLRISFLGIPLFIYGIALALAAAVIVGPVFTKPIGFLLGAVTFTTFLLGVLFTITLSTRREIEGTVAALALYGTIAGFYWIEAYRRTFEVDEITHPDLEVGGNGLRT